jgi:hypothetical protein
MTLDSINYVALFAGALLLMSRSGYRPRLWGGFESWARPDRSEKKSGSHAQRRRKAPVAQVQREAESQAAQPAETGFKPSAGTYVAILTPYGVEGRYFGGHYG